MIVVVNQVCKMSHVFSPVEKREKLFIRVENIALFTDYSTMKITKLWKDVENVSCYLIQQCLLDTPSFVAVSEYIKMSYCQDSNKSWHVKQTFLGVVARQIFNTFPQFSDFHSINHVTVIPPLNGHFLSGQPLFNSPKGGRLMELSLYQH